MTAALKAALAKRKKAAAKIEEMRTAFAANGDAWKDQAERDAWKAANGDYDAANAEVEKLEDAASVGRRADEVAEQLRESRNRRRGIPGREDTRDDGRGRTGRDAGPNAAEDRAAAELAWFRRQGGVEIGREEREACRRAGINPAARSLYLLGSTREAFAVRQAEARNRRPELRTLGTGSSAAGAATVAAGFVPRLEEALLAFGPMLAVAEVMPTETGASLPWPTVNDTGNEGEIVGQTGTIGSSVDPTFGAMTLGAFKFSSKLVRVSAELLEDSAFDLAGYLGGALGERLGRIMNKKFTIGAGTTEPWGIVTRASLGVTCASATAITGDELIRLVHSVDPAYRGNPGVGFMLHDNVLLAVRLLKDSDGQYLWRSGLEAGVPDRLVGYPLRVNQAMASALAAAAKTVLFGDLSKYKVRLVRRQRYRRLVELYAGTDEEGFVGFHRADGDLLDAGTGPVKYLRQL